MLITNVRPWGGDAVDLEVREGRIAAVYPAGTAAVAAEASGGAVDGRGRIAAARVHRRARPPRLHPDRAAVPGAHRRARRVGHDVQRPGELARRRNPAARNVVAGTLERMIARGTTRVRSYAQVDVDCKLEKFRGSHGRQGAVRRPAPTSRSWLSRRPASCSRTGTVQLPGGGAASRVPTSWAASIRASWTATRSGTWTSCSAWPRSTRSTSTSTCTSPATWGSSAPNSFFERTRALGMEGKVTLSHAYELGNVSDADEPPAHGAVRRTGLAMGDGRPGTAAARCRLAG